MNIGMLALAGGLMASTLPIAAHAEYSLTSADWRRPLEGPTYAEFESVAIGDVDGDGRQDLVALTAQHWVHIFRQRANGTLGEADKRSLIAEPCEPQEPLCPDSNYRWMGEIVLADLTGDGKPEIVVPYIGGLAVLSPTAPVRTSVTRYRYDLNNFVVPYRIAAIDADGDAHRDLVAVDWDSPELFIFHGDGRGGFTNHQSVVVGEWFGAGLEVVDLDADGHDDMVYVERNASTPSRSRVHLLFGVAGGGFLPPQALDANDVEQGSAAVADVDGDGHVDIVHGPYLYRQVAARTFAAATVATSMDAYNLRTSDLDGDGASDLASLPWYANAVRYQRGTPEGFGEPVSAPFAFGYAYFQTVSLALGDLNDDGCGDVAAAAGQMGITWLLGSDCAPRPDLATQIGVAGSAVAVRVDNLGPADAGASSVDVELRGARIALKSIPAECASVGPGMFRCNLGTVAHSTQRLLTFVLGTGGLASRSSLTIEARATTPDREVRTTNNFSQKLHRLPALQPAHR